MIQMKNNKTLMIQIMTWNGNILNIWYGYVLEMNSQMR